MSKREVVSRRDLPHWYMPNAMHFVTFRLAGTIPHDVLQKFKIRREALLEQQPDGCGRREYRERVHKLLFADYDRYLDSNREIHWLDDPRVAALVRRSLYFWHGKKYGLCSWCIMPNHVHILVQPLGIEAPTAIQREAQEPSEIEDVSSPLSSIMHSLKSYTAHEANKILRRTGAFWQHESYDHWIRDEEELQRIVDYITANPAQAGLVGRSHQFTWCSAHDRYLFDGDETGWLSFAATDQAASLARSLRGSHDA